MGLCLSMPFKNQTSTNHFVWPFQIGIIWQPVIKKFPNDTEFSAFISLLDILHVLLMRHLTAQCVYQAVREEFTWENVRKAPNQVPLTVKQMKIVTLLCLLERETNFRGIIDEFLIFVRYNLLGKERLFHYKQYQLANLSRIYIALCRLKGERYIKLRTYPYGRIQTAE